MTSPAPASLRSPVALSGATTAELFDGAAAEIEDDDPEWHYEHLLALHRRPTPEVFATARALGRHDDPARRELGVRVLREVGHGNPEAARLRQDDVPLLLELLEREQDPVVLGWVVSAIGNHDMPQALPGVLRLASHADDFVRFHVAANIPRLVDPESPDDDAITALEVLTGDADDEVRGYAIYGLVTELEIDPARVAGTVARLAADPDPHVRWLASGGASPDAADEDTAITLEDLAADTRSETDVVARLTAWLLAAGVPAAHILPLADVRTPGQHVPDLTVWSRPQPTDAPPAVADLLLVIEVGGDGGDAAAYADAAGYAAAGVEHYWTVRPGPEPGVTLHRLTAGGTYLVSAQMPLEWLLPMPPAWVR